MYRKTLKIGIGTLLGALAGGLIGFLWEFLISGQPISNESLYNPFLFAFAVFSAITTALAVAMLTYSIITSKGYILVAGLAVILLCLLPILSSGGIWPGNAHELFAFVSRTVTICGPAIIALIGTIVRLTIAVRTGSNGKLGNWVKRD